MAHAPAYAQAAASISAVSDFRLRGLSLNAGRAAVSTTVTYDDDSGVYMGGSFTTGDTRRFGLRFLGHSEFIGYARRFGPSVSAEIGVSNTQSNSYVLSRFSGSYTEAYVGLSTERLSARVSYTPSFFRAGTGALYLDMNGNYRLRDNARVFGHLGILAPVGRGNPNILPRSRYDVRVGGALELGRGELQLAWVRSGADRGYLAERQQARDALVIGASWFF